MSTRLYGATQKKTVIFLRAAVRICNVTVEEEEDKGSFAERSAIIQFSVCFGFKRRTSRQSCRIRTKLLSSDTGQEEGAVAPQGGSPSDRDRVCLCDEGWLNPRRCVSVLQGMITGLRALYKPSIICTTVKETDFSERSHISIKTY